MNKYEKAFNHLREHASFDTVDEMIDIKELVERATPKKIEMMRIKKYDGNNVGICICGEAIDDSLNEGLKFCPYCGQAIDWRVEDEKI